MTIAIHVASRVLRIPLGLVSCAQAGLDTHQKKKKILIDYAFMLSYSILFLITFHSENHNYIKHVINMII